MNMCLLEVTMCAKSSHVWKMQKRPFPVGGWGGGVGGGSKKFENWGRLKNFRTAGLTDLGGLLLLGEGSSTQLHAM